MRFILLPRCFLIVFRVRDKSDDIAKCLMKYRHVEPFKTTTSHYAVQLAGEILGKIGDHQLHKKY